MAHNADDLHVVTENGEQCFMWHSNQLTYIAQDRRELPLVLANKFGRLATKLDLSYNTLSSFKNIALFTNLNELILDNNHLEDDQLDFRQNLRLKTLSLNKNKLTDLFRLMGSIKTSFPNLEFLSLIGNPLCPDSSGFSESLADPIGSDATPVTSHCVYGQSAEFSRQKYSGQERDSALKHCYWLGERPAAGGCHSRQVETIRPVELNGALQMAVLADARRERESSEPKAAFSRLTYKYTGRNSEGNRFIRNQDL